jgi:hypothetical protein
MHEELFFDANSRCRSHAWLLLVNVDLIRQLCGQGITMDKKQTPERGNLSQTVRKNICYGCLRHTVIQKAPYRE